MSDKAITKSNYDQLSELINDDKVKARFDQALGKRSGAFIASVMTTVAGSPSLMECTPKSIMAGAIKAAVLDLPLLPDLGFACLVPFNNRKTGEKEAQFQIMTNGYKQLAHRTKQYLILNTTKIYEGQEIIEDQLTGQIRLNGKRVSDKVVGWVNYFKLVNGFEKYLYMTLEEIHAHGKRYSKSYGDGLWQTNPAAMEAKTVTKLNLKHNGVMSTAFADDEDEEFVPPENAIPQDEIIDGELTDPEMQPEGTEPQQLDYISIMKTSRYVADEQEARYWLQFMNPLRETDDEVQLWAKTVRGWRDTGLKINEAAAKANKGELPK